MAVISRWSRGRPTITDLGAAGHLTVPLLPVLACGGIGGGDTHVFILVSHLIPSSSPAANNQNTDDAILTVGITRLG